MIGTALASIAGIAGLVCFILVLVQMFQHDKSGLAIACIVLCLCFCGGYLLAFIYGWMKSKEWNITTIMLIWTVAWVIQIAGGALNPPDFSAYMNIGK